MLVVRRSLFLLSLLICGYTAQVQALHKVNPSAVVVTNSATELKEASVLQVPRGGARKSVAAKTTTEGASIGYQWVADGEEPGNHWEVYTGPIEVKEGAKIHVIAHRIGYKPTPPVEL